MDEFDALVSTSGNTEQERRVSACLKSLFDDQLSSKNDSFKTVVIAVTSRPDSIGKWNFWFKVWSLDGAQVLKFLLLGTLIC